MQYVWYIFPINASKHDRYNSCPEDIPLDLVFFTPLRIFACEPLALWSQMELGSCMNPHLSLLCMLAEWRTSLGRWHTITYKYATRQKQAFEFGCADGQGPTSRRGNHVYEIKNWLWNFGRPQPRVGGLSVAKTERIRRQSRSETSRRAWETRKARKEADQRI